MNPLRYAIDITRRVYLEGEGINFLGADLWPLGLNRGPHVIGSLLDVQAPHAMTTVTRPHHHRPESMTAIAATMILLAGCTVGPDFVRPTPQVPAHWSPAQATTEQAGLECVVARNSMIPA